LEGAAPWGRRPELEGADERDAGEGSMHPVRRDVAGERHEGGRAAEQKPYAAAVVAIAAPRDSLANQIAGKRRKEPG
jgi:hypothetical protein